MIKRNTTAMTACAGQYAVLHTQEVTGSSPAVSTKKFLISQEIRNFFLFMPSNSDAAFWRFSHDPNRDPKAERSGKHRRGADGIIRPSLAVFCGLHGLADDAADGVGGGALHSLRGVGVGAEGKARVIVSQCYRTALRCWIACGIRRKCYCRRHRQHH